MTCLEPCGNVQLHRSDFIKGQESPSCDGLTQQPSSCRSGTERSSPGSRQDLKRLEYKEPESRAQLQAAFWQASQRLVAPPDGSCLPYARSIHATEDKGADVTRYFNA